MIGKPIHPPIKIPEMSGSQDQSWIPNLSQHVHPVVDQAIRYLYQSMYDLRDAHAKTAESVKGAHKAISAEVNKPPNERTVDQAAGVLLQPQKAMASPITSRPPNTDILSSDGTIVHNKTNNGIYVFDSSTNPGQFKLLGTLGAPL